MGDIASWQRANNKKTSPLEQAPAQHNAKIYGTPPGASMNSKIAKPTHPAGVCGHGGMAQGFADGGHATKSVTSKTDGWAAHGTRVFAKMADGGKVNPYQGDDVDYFSAARDEDGSIDKGVEMTPVIEPAVETKPTAAKTFKEAFAENRKAGNATFEYNGKKYTTELASGGSTKVAPARVNGKTFSEDVAERKKNLSVERAPSRNENYGNEGRRSVMAPRAGGKGVIDTSNVDSKTLLPKR